MTSPDLNDPEIRALLDKNHVPREIPEWDDDYEQLIELRIECSLCSQPYPCPTRQALRDREKLAKETQLRQTMRSSPHQACGDRRPHGEHTYTGFTRGFYCPGTDYEYVDCDDVISRSHKAHAWNFRGADYWCSGG